MTVADLAIVAALVFGWGALSARLERYDVTAPITFVLAGLLLTHAPLAVLGVTPSKTLIKELAEFTLALVLFSDASRVGLHELRVDAGLYLRLLGAALPLTIGLGTLLALALDGSASIWLALLVGAALAPTDAALGAGMISNQAIPARIRRLINVESGLNDGIATPFVTVALAGAATGGEVAGHGPAAAAAELAVGLLVGVAAGGGGGLLVNTARRRGWVADGFAGPAVLGLAVCAYASAVALHGNGFIAAFVGGLAFGTAGGPRGQPLVPFVEETGSLVSLLVWLAFGAIAVVPAVESLNWQIVLYAVLSLTVIRMAPVAVALAGDTARPGHDRPGGLVRSPWPGVGGVRPAGAGGTGQLRCQSRHRRHHDHRIAQRRRPRCHGRSAGHPVRTTPRPSARRACRCRNTRHTGAQAHPPAHLRRTRCGEWHEFTRRRVSGSRDRTRTYNLPVNRRSMITWDASALVELSSALHLHKACQGLHGHLAVVLPCAGEYRFVRVVPVLIFVRGPNLCWLCVASNALASSGHRRSGALQAAASGWHRPRPRITLIQNDDPQGRCHILRCACPAYQRTRADT